MLSQAKNNHFFCLKASYSILFSFFSVKTKGWDLNDKKRIYVPKYNFHFTPNYNTEVILNICYTLTWSFLWVRKRIENIAVILQRLCHACAYGTRKKYPCHKPTDKSSIIIATFQQGWRVDLNAVHCTFKRYRIFSNLQITFDSAVLHSARFLVVFSTRASTDLRILCCVSKEFLSGRATSSARAVDHCL